jgi:hypothetical protein
MPGALQVLEETGAPAADTFDPEGELIGVGERLSPLLQLGVASPCRWDRELSEDLSNLVERDGIVTALCGCRPRLRSSFLLIVWRGTLVMWRPSDRAVLSDVQASMKSRRHPVAAAGDRSLIGH